MKFTFAIAAILSVGASSSILLDTGTALSGENVTLSESSGPTRFGHDTAQFAESSNPTRFGRDTAMA